MNERYTHNKMEADLEAINQQLKIDDINLVFVAGQRYGYSAIDYGTNEQIERHCIQSTLDAGKPPRILIEKARAYANAETLRVMRDRAEQQ